MFTKGEKIIHSISTEARTPNGVELHAGSIHHAAEMALQVGGSFTAKDVATLLKWCANVALGSDGRKAVAGLTAEYERSVREIRELCHDAIKEANKRADAEYDREYEEFEDRIDELEARNDELEERAEEMSDVPEVVKDAVYELFARVTEKQLGYQETWELAKYIENYGLAVDQYGFPVSA